MSWLSRIIDKQVSKTVTETVKNTINEVLPKMVRRMMADMFRKEPNAPLSAIGFDWALSMALREHWPNVEEATARDWLKDYLGVNYGAPGFVFTYASAQDLAASYVSEFGEPK